MKNKVLIVAALLTLACAANSFAAAVGFTWLSTTAPVGGGDQTMAVTAPVPALTFKPSAGVVMGYSSHTTGATYSLGSYHVTGTFTYATTSTDTNIYRYPTAAGNATQANVQKGPDAPASASTALNWTSVAGVAWTASK